MKKIIVMAMAIIMGMVMLTGCDMESVLNIHEQKTLTHYTEDGVIVEQFIDEEKIFEEHYGYNEWILEEIRR